MSMKTPINGKRITLTLGLTIFTLGIVFILIFQDDLRKWYEFQQIFESLGLNEQGYPEFKHRKSEIIMVQLPGGKFLMGSEKGEPERMGNEGPVHEVELSPFLIAKYEVTQEQWQRIMAENPSVVKENPYPVVNVTWEECQKFCQRAGFYLPTEAQWEYACRAGTRTPFFFGDRITTDQVNYNGRWPGKAEPGEYRAKTLPVNSLKPNAFGIHHVHGNVWEWCEDLFDRGFYSNPNASKSDPVNTTQAKVGIRIKRGGGYGINADGCRSGRRGNMSGKSKDRSTGFRVVYSSRLTP